jgi:hypothetical protein
MFYYCEELSAHPYKAHTAYGANYASLYRHYVRRSMAVKSFLWNDA